MDQSLVLELIKQLAVGFTAARSYPAGHPVFERAVISTMSALAKLFAESSKFRIVISEDAVVFQDLRVEIGNNLALTSFLNNLKKKNVQSITFARGAKQDDISRLYSVMVAAQSDIDTYGDMAAMLQSKGTKSVIINAAQEALSSKEKAVSENKTHEEIIESIRSLIDIVRARAAVSESITPFAMVINDIEKVSRDEWSSYSEAVSGVVELLPLEKRVALLQDVEMKPFVLTMMSRLSAETLVELITNWERQGRKDFVARVMGVISKEKFKEIVPQLRHRQLNVFEYLANTGIDLLKDDDVTATITEDDLKIVMQPYYNMLEAQSEGVRADAFKSLVMLTRRLIEDKKYDMADGIVMRIVLAIQQESSDDVIIRSMNELEGLYAVMAEHKQNEFCERVIEPFGGIWGRAGMSIDLRKRIVKFLSLTNNSSVLPILFSFLWESGVYPDVRAAIQQFGGRAVEEAIQFLRDAEDFSVRMKLVDVLKNIGEESIEVLTSNLDAREWYLRRNIVRIIGDIGERAVIPRLEKVINDDDFRVRLELVRTYTKLGFKDGLLKALGDVSLEVKGEALRGLRSMLDAEEVIDLLPGLSESGDDVYIELLKTIDEKKVYEAMNWVADLMKRIAWRTDAVSIRIKELGVSALAKLDGDNAKMILLDLQQSKDKTLSNLASTALRRIG
jgi:HEAT repeat protein